MAARTYAEHLEAWEELTETELQRRTGYASAASTDYVSAENRSAAQFAREDFRSLTMADVERQAEQMRWGTAAEVTERITEPADSAGAENVHISLNRGVLPHEMFMQQIRRFACDVLPALQTHQVVRVPLAEEVYRPELRHSPVLTTALKGVPSGPC